jgi:hypothetical protein
VNFFFDSIVTVQINLIKHRSNRVNNNLCTNFKMESILCNTQKQTLMDNDYNINLMLTKQNK